MLIICKYDKTRYNLVKYWIFMKSEIRNQKSEIRNQKSEIRNQVTDMDKYSILSNTVQNFKYRCFNLKEKWP